MPNIDHLIRTDFRAVEKSEELRKVLGWLRGDVEEPPILTDDGKPVGILNDRSLMRRRLDWRSKVDNHLLATRAAGQKDDARSVAKSLLEFRAAYLPVHDDKGKTKGYVRALDVARELHNKVTAGNLFVPVTTLSTSQTMGEALHVFGREYVDYLPVRENDGRVRGVLSRRTLMHLESGRGHGQGRQDAGRSEPTDLLDGHVGGFLETSMVTVSQDTGREEVFEKLQKFGYTLVMGRDDHFLGIVTPETLFENEFPAKS